MKKYDMSREANAVRKKLGEDAFSPIDIFSMALREDNTSVVFAELGKNISGVFYRNDDSKTIIINSSMSLGRQRFSMAHELYHLNYDFDSQTIVCPQKIAVGNENERKADAFAACLLMPRDGIFSMVQEQLKDKNNLQWKDIISLEQYYGVSHAALILRLLEEDLINKSEYEKFSDKVVARAEMLDFDTSLYRSTNVNKTSGHYLQLARELHDKDILSDSKYKEILSDAFMEDVALGSVEIGDDTFE